MSIDESRTLLKKVYERFTVLPQMYVHPVHGKAQDAGVKALQDTKPTLDTENKRTLRITPSMLKNLSFSSRQFRYLGRSRYDGKDQLNIHLLLDRIYCFAAPRQLQLPVSTGLPIAWSVSSLPEEL